MFALIDPRVWGLFALSLIAAATAGYLTKAHYAAIELAEAEARKKTIVETVTKVVTVTDTRAVAVLQAKLKKSEARARALADMIKEESDANPADDKCRVSDGLRDELNRQLSTGQE